MNKFFHEQKFFTDSQGIIHSETTIPENITQEDFESIPWEIFPI